MSDRERQVHPWVAKCRQDKVHDDATLAVKRASSLEESCSA